MIITTQRPLTIKQLIWKHVSDQKNNNEWGKGFDTIFTHKSWVSLYTVFQIYSDLYKRKPNVLVPEYYFDDTLQILRGVSNIYYYKINEELEIDIDNCNALFKNKNNKYDFLIAVHYFGKEFDFNNIKNMCKNNNIILIEDAVHVLSPCGKIGKFGDIVIFSPWESFGFFDGAVLIINSLKLFDIEKQELVEKIINTVTAYPVIAKRTLNKWIFKKIVQKIIPYIEDKRIVLKDYHLQDSIVDSHPQLRQISNYSLGLIKTISINEIAKLSDRKKEISLSIVDYLSKKYHITPFYNGIEKPYAITIAVPNMAEKKEIMLELRKIGKICYEWPNLPKNLPADSNAYKLRDKILCIAVHDGITLGNIRRKLKFDDYYSPKRRKIYHLQRIEEKEYDDFTRLNYTPILQSSSYVSAKQAEQGWGKKQWSIKDDKQTVAVFSVLTKFGIIHRINNGPVYLNGIGKTEKIEIIRAIKNRFSGIHGILFFAPNIERTGYNLNALTCMGFKYRKAFYKTGLIDLTIQPDLLRNSLSSKWRNLLRSAEKKDMCIKKAETMEEFEALLELHKADKKLRDYSDSGDNITLYLFKNKGLIPLYVKNQQGDIISFMFFALHGSTATYYIGWSNEEGFKNNASRLLIWQGMLMLQKKGFHWFDVGGIDYVHTKGIADFKEGTGCSIFDYVGEFLAI